jgi:hypothetical protein
MQMEIPAIIPEDSSISKKIAERLSSSNYVISPIRNSYNKVFDATTLVLMASHYLLLGSNKNVKNTRLKLANTLLPSACTEQTNQFILGRDDPYGALYQKFKHAQLLHIEQEDEIISKSYDPDQEQSQRWSLLTMARTERLAHLRSGESSPSPEEWSEEVERTINNLNDFINQFKHIQTQTKPTQNKNIPFKTIQALFATSFSPANDERIRNWINYPGVSTAIRRSREITDLVTDVSIQPPQGLSNILDPGSTLHECVQEIIQLS